MSSIVRLGLVLLFLACAWYSAGLSIENAKIRTLADVARKLERSRIAFADGKLDTILASDAMALAHQSCRSDILRPALTIELVSASMRDAGADYDGWASAMQGADQFTRHMIRCMPAEGNAWLRQVMLSRAIAENPQEIAAKIAVAAALSPFEGIQLQARLNFWHRASEATRMRARDTLVQDVWTVLQYGDDRLLALVTIGSTNTLKSYLGDELGSVASRINALGARQRRLQDAQTR